MKCDMGRAMTHQFNSEVAVKLGVNAAIIIANLAYLQHNRQAQGGEKYYMDERWWVHHTYESLQKVNPYFSVQKIRRIMRDLVQQEDCLADNASLRYKGRSKEHIPQADTYLSQNKWEDEQDHASAQPKQRWL